MLRFCLIILFFFVFPEILAQNILDMKIGNELKVPKMGYNSPLIHSPEWSNLSFTNAIANLSPQLIRYPGGSNSFYWNWEKGRTKNYTELSSSIIHIDKKYSAEFLENNSKVKTSAFWKQLKRYNTSYHRDNTIPQFAEGLKNTGAQAIFVLNIISSSLEDQLEMLKTAKNNAIEISFIEIGNEINNKHELLQKKYPNSKAYADTCEKWINKIWEFFPNTEIGIVGGSKNQFKDWNQILAKRFNRNNKIHFILHHYPILYHEVDLEKIHEYQKFISLSKLDLKKKLNEWKWNATNNYSTWVTEFNIIQKTKRKIHNTWAHALFTSNQIHHFIENTNVEILTFHSIGSNKFSQFSALDLTNPVNGEFLMTAPGVTTYLWNKLILKADQLNKIELNNSVWKIDDFKFNPIHAYQSIKNKTKQILICNSSKKEYKIQKSQIDIQDAQIEQYFGNLTDNNSDKLKTSTSWKKRSQKINNAIIIPAYSISLITEN